MSIALDSNATITGLIPAEKMRGIYDLCRQHVSNNTLDMLLDGIARQSVDILGVRYSRILGLEIDGSFTCRAVHSNDRQDLAYRCKRSMPSQTQVLFQDALLRETPLGFKPGHLLPAALPTVLRLKCGDSLYLVPLRNQREVFGLMVLGEETCAVSEAALAEKLRLAGMIADQAAGAFSRARLSISLEESEIQTILALAREQGLALKVAIVSGDDVDREIEVDAIFVELDLIPRSTIVRDLVALDDKDRIIIDEFNRTSAPGIFAAGDVTNGFSEQVLISIGEGAKAALSAYDYLLKAEAEQVAAD